MLENVKLKTVVELVGMSSGQFYIAGGQLADFKFHPPHPSHMRVCQLKSQVPVRGDPDIGQRPFRNLQAWSICASDSPADQGRLCKLLVNDLVIIARGDPSQQQSAPPQGKKGGGGGGRKGLQAMHAVGDERGSRVASYGWRGDVKVRCIGSDDDIRRFNAATTVRRIHVWLGVLTAMLTILPYWWRAATL